MRALGTLRRKPSLEKEVQEVVVNQPLEVITPVLPPAPQAQVELSSDFEGSVELS
jgi:hypothetical protein